MPKEEGDLARVRAGYDHYVTMLRMARRVARNRDGDPGGFWEGHVLYHLDLLWHVHTRGCSFAVDCKNRLQERYSVSNPARRYE